MAYEIIVGVIAAAMCVALLICKKTLDDAREYCELASKLVETVAGQYDKYKDLMDTAEKWYDEACESNHLVDEHYAQILDQNKIILAALKLPRDNNKQEGIENGMAV